MTAISRLSSALEEAKFWPVWVDLPDARGFAVVGYGEDGELNRVGMSSGGILLARCSTDFSRFGARLTQPASPGLGYALEAMALASRSEIDGVSDRYNFRAMLPVMFQDPSGWSRKKRIRVADHIYLSDDMVDRLAEAEGGPGSRMEGDPINALWWYISGRDPEAQPLPRSEVGIAFARRVGYLQDRLEFVR